MDRPTRFLFICLRMEVLLAHEIPPNFPYIFSPPNGYIDVEMPGFSCSEICQFVVSRAFLFSYSFLRSAVFQ